MGKWEARGASHFLNFPVSPFPQMPPDPLTEELSLTLTGERVVLATPAGEVLAEDAAPGADLVRLDTELLQPLRELTGTPISAARLEALGRELAGLLLPGRVGAALSGVL